MALDERADAVTTVDADEADTSFPGLSVAPEPTNGRDHEPVADEHEDAVEPDVDGSTVEAETSPFAPPPSAATTNGTGSIDRVRPGRKRTSKQRSLLLAEAAAAEAAEDELTGSEPAPAAHVDPLLAAAEQPMAEAEPDDEPVPDAEPASEWKEPEPAPAPFLLPASATATAASAAVAFAPSPSVTRGRPARRAGAQRAGGRRG